MAHRVTPILASTHCGCGLAVAYVAEGKPLVKA